jgi:adenylate cyclase
VRADGSRLRVVAQLIDAETTHHLSAERYDCDMTSTLGLHDDIVTSIVGALEPELLRVERDRAASRGARSQTAYDLLQRGLWHHYRRTKPDNAMAETFFRNALATDPDYAQAHAALAIALTYALVSGWHDEPDAATDHAFDHGRSAVALDARDPFAHFALGAASLENRKFELALAENEEAVRLNPSYAAAHANLGFINNYLNRAETARQSVQKALRLSPSDPRRFIWLPALAGSYYLSGEYESAIEAGQRGLALKPDYLIGLRWVVAALGQLGRADEAASLLPQLRRLDKDLSGTEPVLARHIMDRAAIDHILEGLRKAGFT